MFSRSWSTRWSRRAVWTASLAVAAAALIGMSSGRALAGPNEGDFFGAANAARASAGLPAYAYAGDLSAVARAQAERMASSGSLYHNPDLGGAVSNWQGLAENVGTGTNFQVIQQAFMNSADHRAAILDSGYTQMGVGTAVDKKGTLWVSEVFRLPAGASAPAPSAGSSGDASQGTSPTPVSGTSGTVAAATPTPTQILRGNLAEARQLVSHRRVGGKHLDPLQAAIQYTSVMETVAP